MKYRNPILYSDFSDPDVVRVGSDFYMVSSSFTYLPGIPVMHSRDLVHWELISYAAERLPFDRYNVPAHRCGTWAPSIRYHDGLFMVYVCLPDEGLLAFTARDPAGMWECHHVMDVCGWIDPCPLFAEDGSAWLVHALAGSRCGLNNMLFLHRLSDDGLQVLDRGTLVYNGTDFGDRTVEGAKFYQRDGKYWILCPAGGVKHGYQLALRSDSVQGPYERKVVLFQGDSPVNGPHQGAWFDDGHGREWFIHFQDVEEYGRVTHLQPVAMADGWPVMGNEGVPVPGGDTGLKAFPVGTGASDDFAEGLGLQWQWQANPNMAWYRELKPGLRLHAAPARSLFEAGQFLSQLMRERNFDWTVSLKVHARSGDAAGIGMMGYGYSYAALEDGRVVVRRGTVTEGTPWMQNRVEEETVVAVPWDSPEIRLRMRVREGMVSYLYGGEELATIGGSYPMVCGGWTSARPGIFCMNSRGAWGGWADFREMKAEKA